MSVQYMSFSAHADAKGIMQLIRQSEPKNIVLVHGEAVKMEFLTKKIEQEFGLKHTIHPSIHPFHPLIQYIHSSIFPPIHPLILLTLSPIHTSFIHPPMHPPICTSIHPFIHSSVYPFIRRFFHPLDEVLMVI